MAKIHVDPLLQGNLVMHEHDVSDLSATGTPSASTYLRGDGSWATPAGSGAVDSVNGATGVVVLDQDDVGDGTTYKQYSATEKTKLSGIASGAEVNVNADWNSITGDSEILNKPTIPTQYTDELAQDAVGNVVGNGLDYDDTTGAISVDETELTHNSLGSKQGGTAGEYYHLTSAQHTVVGNTSGTNTGDQDLSGYQLKSEKGQANGYASLGADGKVPTAELNPLAITSTYVVASEAEQLALTVQEGDVAVRSDLNKSFIHNGGTAGTMADWTELLTPTDSVLSVDGQTGTVSLSGSYEPKNANIQSHISSTSNPHSVTYSQVGAEPANANIQSHISSTSNPHSVTAAQAGAVDLTGDTMTGELDLPSTEIGDKNPGYFNVISNGTPYIYRANTNLTDDTPIFMLRRAKGSIASPTAVESGYGLGAFEVGAHDGTKYTSGWNGGAGFSVIATENWSSTAHGASFNFNTTQNGSANWATRMTIDNGGNVGIGTSAPSQKLDVNGNVKATDIYSYQTGFGLGARATSNIRSEVTSHFSDSASISGYSWQGSPFVSPTTNTYIRDDYLYIGHSSTNQRMFYAKTVTNSASAWQFKKIDIRARIGVNANLGLRFDDGTDNNYGQIYLTSLNNGTSRLDFSYRVSGGTPVVNTSAIIVPSSTYLNFSLYCYYTGGNYYAFGYVFGEDAVGINIVGFNSVALSGFPAAGRVGIFMNTLTSAANPGLIDWYHDEFL